MHTLTLSELAKKLRAKEFSVTELTKSLLSRIEKSQPTLNAFITVTAESALAQARVAESTLASGNASPLTGLPLAHKDIFCTQGVKTSCGSKMLDNFVSPYDATVVEKLSAAGMITLGKTNMDEFAMGSSNETSSVTRTLRLPAPVTLATTFAMSHGARNWPFLTLIAAPVAAAAASRSVCRQRKAGIWSTSTTSATRAHCPASCTSVRTVSAPTGTRLVAASGWR